MCVCVCVCVLLRYCVILLRCCCFFSFARSIWIYGLSTSCFCVSDLCVRNQDTHTACHASAKWCRNAEGEVQGHGSYLSAAGIAPGSALFCIFQNAAHSQGTLTFSPRTSLRGTRLIFYSALSWP